MTTRLKRRLVDAGEQPDPVAEPVLLGDVDGHRLGERLDLEDAGHHRQAREVALEEPLGRGDALDPDDPLRLGVVLDDAVDEQERPAVRDQRLDLAGRVDVAVAGGLGRGAAGRVVRRSRASPWCFGSQSRRAGAWRARRCVQVCMASRGRWRRGRAPSRAGGGGQEGRAPHAVEQVRGEPSLEERLVARAAPAGSRRW